jgi:hypothetical protein
MQRRFFLKSILLFSTGLAITRSGHQGWQGWIGDHQTALSQKLEKNLVKVFGSLNSANAIGQEYLKQMAAPLTKADLFAQVFGVSNRELVVLADMNPHQLRAWLNARQSRDFANGRIVTLQGWVLSQTEVQVCAWLSLARG